MRLIPANADPDMLCHTLNIAPGSVARGFAAKFIAAKDMASPLFCIATSIATAVTFSYLILNSFTRLKPRSNPNRLCNTRGNHG